MNSKRKLERVYTPDANPGFLGRGHVARPVLRGSFDETDPFIILMDDLLDKKDDEPVGGPHPHAGFETVTFVVEGEVGDGERKMKAGDFEMMTAGHGIIHTETIREKTRMRILQLWLRLPSKDRWALPRVQSLRSERVPVSSRNGVDIRLYSGSFAGLASPVQNYTPLILADIRMAAGSSLQEVLPGDFKAFVYVLEGRVNVDDVGVEINQVGWFSSTQRIESVLELHAGDEGARFVLYAAQPQNYPIVSHGPFIAQTMDEIKQLYADFRYGKMEHIHEVAEERQMVH